MLAITEADNLYLYCTRNAQKIVEYYDDKESPIITLLKMGKRYLILDTKFVSDQSWYLVKQDDGQLGWYNQEKHFQFVV